MVGLIRQSPISSQKLYLGLILLCVYVGVLNLWLDNGVTSSGLELGKGKMQAIPVDNIQKQGRRRGSADSATNISIRIRTKHGLSRDPKDPQPPHGPVKLKPMRYHNRLMVVPEYKLLFCYVEKVGCSMFNQLFRLLRIYHPEVNPEERDWLSQSHFGRANPDHFNMTLGDLSKMVADDAWTKAVFFRDPADRFLSGFKSKCGKADADGGRHCKMAFGKTPDPKGGKSRPILDGSVTSFHHSIDIAINNTRAVFGNPHFNPAAHFCGGLGETINQYSFVHELDKKTVSTHVKTLFDHLGVDADLTEELIQRTVKTGGILHPIDVERVREKYGLRIRGNISASHHTEQHHISTRDYYESPYFLRLLQDVYERDYSIFQLEKPQFEQLR